MSLSPRRSLLAAGLATLLLASAPSVHAASVADNPLSVHVLHLQDGLPSPGVEVSLERQDGARWLPLNRATTNAQGRITALFPAGEALAPGVYRVTFHTGAWYAKAGVSSFFPEVPVVFRVDGSVKHTHIPLLLSPYGFSTYRGN
jgi:5-hydroxyisourate hydrolase